MTNEIEALRAEVGFEVVVVPRWKHNSANVWGLSASGVSYADALKRLREHFAALREAGRKGIDGILDDVDAEIRRVGTSNG